MTESTRAGVRATGAFLAMAALWGILGQTLADTAGRAVSALIFAALLIGIGGALFWVVRRGATETEQSRNRLQSLVDQPLAGVYLIQDGRFRFVNRKFADILGYSEDELTSSVVVDDVIHDEDRAAVLAIMRARLGGSREEVNHSFRVVRKDGTAVPVEVWGSGAEWKGRPAVVGLLIDQTPGRSTVQQLRRSQKLESIGEFTGAVAHDFNNLLTAIITPVQLALADMDTDHPLRSQLEEVEAAAGRGAALSRQLLAFSRKQVVQPKPHDLNEIIGGLEAMLGRLLGPSVKLETVLDPRLNTVVVDPTQMEQVLVNLVVNARDAMPDGGHLVIRTANVDPSKDPVRTDEPTGGAGHVTLTISDTGHGFDDRVKSRIFEPYYTTKAHGTGLGLSTVFGIARQAGGFVRVESAPDEGASFSVYLPAITAAAEPIALKRVRPAAIQGGSELVLVVEDQAPVRQVVIRALTRFGYRVVEASSAEQALEQAGELGGRLDLLLTDVMLPGLSGPELAARLLEDRPRLKVLYVSGYADQDAFDGIETGEDWLFLPKPFSVEDLLERVRVVLDRASAVGSRSG